MIPAPLQGLDLLCLLRENPARTGTAWAGFLEPASIIDAAKRLLEARYHLEDISALDVREGFLVAYFFDHMEEPCRICLGILASHENPIIPSIAHVYQGADWHEREAADFFGITFEGHPNLIRLLLPGDMEDWPLRKAPEARAPLRLMFGTMGGEMVLKKEGFTLMDAPEPQAEAPSKPAPAATQEA